MPAIRTQIDVARCSECPLFERGAVSVISDFISKNARRSGTCKHGGISLMYPLGRTHVPDESIVPQACPLKTGDVLIQISSRLKA